MPAVLTASTVRMSSCCPWSYSLRSSPVSRRPVPEMVTPTSSSRRSEGHSRSLGPRTSASGSASAAASSAASASGAGFASSWMIQTQSESPMCSRPSWTATGNDVDDGARTTASAPNADSRRSTEASLLPVSTATTRPGAVRWP